MYALKQGKREIEPVTPYEPATISSFSSARAELRSLQSGLIELGDKLALDIILVATHPEVQFLDEAVQRIGKIVQTIEMRQLHSFT